jgi:Zn-dependent protease
VRFRVAGFPVRIDPFFFVTMALLGLAASRSGALVVEWVVVAGVSILVHELGHAFAFRRFGSSAEITLSGFGGVTVGAAQPPLRSIVVSVAGPFVGFTFGFLFLWIERSTTTDSVLVANAVADLVFVNLAWGIFNLLPILPLDGGNVVASFLEHVTHGRGQRAARSVSIVTAVALAAAGLGLGQPFVALIAAYFAYLNWQSIARAKDQPQLHEVEVGRAALLQGDVDQAVATAERIAASAGSAKVRTAAVELLAWAHLAAGRPARADAALARLGGGVSASQLVRSIVELANGRAVPPLAPAFGACTDAVAAIVAAPLVLDAGRLDGVLVEISGLAPAQMVTALRALQLGLHHSGRFEDSARVGALLYETIEEADVAYNVACSQSRAGNVGEALVWLNHAVVRGYDDAAKLDSDPDLAQVRDTDGFRALRSSIGAGPPAAPH